MVCIWSFSSLKLHNFLIDKKKTGIDQNDLKDYSPVSNFPLTSKLIEKKLFLFKSKKRLQDNNLLKKSILIRRQPLKKFTLTFYLLQCWVK